MPSTRADRLVVVGQGYAGLPVAIRAVAVGFDVIGYDIVPEPSTVALLSAGLCLLGFALRRRRHA